MENTKNAFENRFTTIVIQKDNNQTIHLQFENRREFEYQMIKLAPENYQHLILPSIIHVLEDPVQNKKDFLIFCLDEHEFSNDYNVTDLDKVIQKAKELGVDILTTRLSYFCCSIPIDDNLSWVESVESAKFIIMFKKFYLKFTTSFMIPNESLYSRIARLSDNKVVKIPLLSTSGNEHSKNSMENDIQKNNPGLMALQASDKIYHFYRELQKAIENGKSKILVEEISIPTYIINLSERVDRHAHIVNEFKEKPEFDLKIMKAHKHSIGAIGLWISIKEIIKLALENDDDVIIICEDDHEFTSDYSKQNLFRNIFEGFQQYADYINGGTSTINVVVPVSRDRYWVDSTRATQFMIIYKRFFEKILNYEFAEDVIADIVLSNLAETKMILFPFISKQHNFGYSDVTPQHNMYTNLVDEMFSNTERRLVQIKNAFERYNNKIS